MGEQMNAKDAWGTDLTELGIEQAKQIASRLHDVKFDAAFSSDLLRAKHTAEIIALEHKLAVITNDTIRESNAHSFHHYDKDKQAEMKKLISQLGEAEKLTYRGDDDMETYEEAATRLITFIREIAIAYEGKTVLVVAHGTLMRSFLIKIGHGSYDQLGSGSIDNTGLAIIESDGSDFIVKETSGINKFEII
jgi:probable phosphoglycerate mutase